MTRYRPYLILSTVYEIFYTFTIGFLLQGYPVGPQNEPTVMFTGLLVLLFKIDGTRIGMALFYSGFALVAIGQTMCLLYRYLVFHTKRQNLFHFIFAKKRIRFVHVLLYAFVIGMGYLGASELSLGTTETEFGTTAVYISNDKKTDPLKLIGLVLLLILLWEAMYFGMVARILQLMQPKIATFSPNTIRLHRQLSYLLLAQAISPLFCMVIPVVLAAMDKLIVDKCFGFQRIQVSFLMSVAQMAISSILTIGFIQPYRSRFKKLIINFLVCLRMRVKDAEQTRAPVVSISNNTQSQTI